MNSTMTTTLFGEADGVLGLVMVWFSILFIAAAFVLALITIICHCGGERAAQDSAAEESVAAGDLANAQAAYELALAAYQLFRGRAAEQNAAAESLAVLRTGYELARAAHGLCQGGPTAEEIAAAERLAALLEAFEGLIRLAAPAPVVELGCFPYSAEGGRASEELVCAICQDEFQQGQMCSEVPACRHLFHRDCIEVWRKSKTTCPLCRRSIVAGSERVSAADDMV
ncbi:hypothetical protein ACQJBY_063723 [Aegilops geniculata]